MRNIPITIATGTSAATITGSAQYVGQGAAASFIFVTADATAAGTLKVQGSNEPPAKGTNVELYVPSASSFADISSATSTIATGVGPAIVLANLPFQFVRVIWTRSAGASSAVTISMSMLAL